MADTGVARGKKTEGQQAEGMERYRPSEESTRSGRQGLTPWLIRPTDFFSLNPFSLMRRFSEDVDRMLGSTRPGAGVEELRVWAPPVDVTERDGNLVVTADLPGLNKEDVKVEATDEGLILRGERKKEREEEREGYRLTERQHGSFYRVIPLPEGANIDQARADFKNGVLEVTIPVPEQQRRGREIPISTDGEERKPVRGESAGREGEHRAKVGTY